MKKHILSIFTLAMLATSCPSFSGEAKVITAVSGSASLRADSYRNAKAETVGMGSDVRIVSSDVNKIGDKYFTTIKVEYNSPVKK